MEINDIIKLIEVVSEHGLTSFVLEENGSKISMKKEKETIVTTNTMIPAAAPYGAVGTAAVSGALISAASPPATEAAAQAEVKKPEAPASTGAENIVKSPLVGTFFEAPTEGAQSFVKVGDKVKKGQVLGIIEAMKLLNEIESEFDGVVEAILVKNGEVVEYGQPMFRIK